MLRRRYLPGYEREILERALKEPESELDGAKTPTALEAAAKKLMRAPKEALKRLKAEVAP